MPRVPVTSAGRGQTAESRRARGPFGADRDPSARRHGGRPLCPLAAADPLRRPLPFLMGGDPTAEPRGPSHRAAGVKAQEARKMDTLIQCFEQTELIF